MGALRTSIFHKLSELVANAAVAAVDTFSQRLLMPIAQNFLPL
jgi:hypothetical protein